MSYFSIKIEKQRFIQQMHIVSDPFLTPSGPPIYKPKHRQAIWKECSTTPGLGDLRSPCLLTTEPYVLGAHPPLEAKGDLRL